MVYIFSFLLLTFVFLIEFFFLKKYSVIQQMLNMENRLQNTKNKRYNNVGKGKSKNRDQ